jgi:hypothetical protein
LISKGTFDVQKCVQHWNEAWVALEKYVLVESLNEQENNVNAVTRTTGGCVIFIA